MEFRNGNSLKSWTTQEGENDILLAKRQRKRRGNGRHIVEGASGAGGILSWKPCRAFLYLETTNVRVLCRRKHLWLPLSEKKRRMWMCRLEERNGERVTAQTRPFDLILDFSETRTDRTGRLSNEVPCNAKVAPTINYRFLSFSHCNSHSRMHGNFDRTHGDWMTFCVTEIISVFV